MESRQDIEAAAAAWIARRDLGPWTDAENDAFEAWLAESPGRRVAYYRLHSAWQEAARLKAFVGATPLPAPRQLQWKNPSLWRSLAASLLLVVGVGAFVFQATRSGEGAHATTVGSIETVPMSDGSRVILNTDSRLSIALSQSERHVDLKRGEAFFQVAKDPSRPFVVSAGDKKIIAVGTAFSVRREGDTVRVIVSEGVVRMETPDKKYPSPGPLPAGSVARARNNDVLVQTVELANIERTLSWRSGVLTFRDTPLAAAIGEFNRYNSRQIVIEGEQIGSLQIGGVFRATEPDAFVHLLEEAFPIEASVDAQRIVLRAN